VKPVLPAFLLLAAPWHAAACSAAAPADPQAARAAQLEAMTRRCGVSAKTLVLLGPNEVTIEAGPEVEWGKIECLIHEIRKADPRLQYMFTGNAPYETDNRQ
jgi:plastocyanin